MIVVTKSVKMSNSQKPFLLIIKRSTRAPVKFYLNSERFPMPWWLRFWRAITPWIKHRQVFNSVTGKYYD